MHSVGTIDPRVIEVCATDKRVEKESVEARKYNHHPSNIYTHYFI